jgi:hypothetical protein
MSLFKRPSQRVRCPPPIRGDKPKEGAFLYDIIISKPIEVFTFHKRPVYKEGDYLKALKKNHQNLGIPYEEPRLPKAPPPRIYEPLDEPEIKYGDTIQVLLRVLKNGTMRVKVNGAIATMYEKYYRRGKEAPIKTILQAYKAHGFSKDFLEKIRKSHEKKLKFAEKVPNILDKIFEKEPTKKSKKKIEEKKIEEKKIEEKNIEEKNIEEEVIADEIPEEEVEEDQVPDEEGQLDVEPDEEEIVDDEEYVSDPET